MRGKKIDTDYVAKFVGECVKKNRTSSEEICEEAKKLIELIDQKIIEAEGLKKTRSKLCDVLISFDETKKDLSKDKVILDFHKISSKVISGTILEFLNQDVCSVKFLIDNLKKRKYSEEDINFTIKQMIELDIVVKDDKALAKAERYSDFYSFMKECYFTYGKDKQANQ